MRRFWLALLAFVGLVSGCGEVDLLECRWHWKHCGTAETVPAAQPTPAAPADPCHPVTIGINDTLCQTTLAQDSYWSTTSGIGTIYWHFLPDQTWEQYLVVTLPVINKTLIEKREGTLQLSASAQVLTLALATTSCSGDSSFFKIFDAASESLTVARYGATLGLLLSPPMVLSAQGAYTDAIASAEAHLVALEINVILAPFSTQFWTDIVRGTLQYTTALPAALAASLAAGRIGCVSEAGIKSVLPKIP